jgi:hypothetical protein
VRPDQPRQHAPLVVRVAVEAVERAADHGVDVEVGELAADVGFGLHEHPSQRGVHVLDDAVTVGDQDAGVQAVDELPPCGGAHVGGGTAESGLQH